MELATGTPRHLRLVTATVAAGQVSETGAMALASGGSREAFGRRAWEQAYRELVAQEDDGGLPVEDLDRLATAAYLTGRDEEAFDLWGRAHQRQVVEGDVVRAVWFGARLASGLSFKGDIARASGWADRTRRLIDDAGLDCVEAGYLDHAAATCLIFATGDVAGARAGFVRAGKVGRRFDNRELVALAQISEGRCLLYLGEVVEGLALMDEAMVAVEAGDVSPINTGDAYCTVIDGCHELFDLRRCDTWIESFTRWCDAQPDLVLYRGNCLLHRAALLLLRGRWDDGVADARGASRRLSAPVNHLVLGRAHYVEGEYHRLRGAWKEAEASYMQANERGFEPQPGLALLRLAQGERQVADAGIRRVLGETGGMIRRARLLDAYVEIVLAGGDVADARSAAEELATTATALCSPFLEAQARRSAGMVLLAEGNAEAALVELRQAFRRWSDLEATFDAARTRVLLARACRELSDVDGENIELQAAHTTLTALGAATAMLPLKEQATSPRLPGGLTEREVEVLCLVAAGKTNRGIAQDLFLSEKTVASHLSHILTKLGLPSRAAATAYAYEHGLIRPGQWQ